MNVILKDIAIGGINGIMCVNATGEHCVIFLDPVTVRADWSALSASKDSTGNSSNVLCLPCVFRKSKKTAAASIVYTGKIHSRRMSLMRSYES